MTREFLEQFGLDKEQINQILNQASNDIGKAIDKKEQELGSEKVSIDDLKQKLETANNTISQLQKDNADNSKLQKQIESYQKQIEEQNKQAEKNLINYALDLELTKAGAINSKAVIPFVELDKVSVKDGTIIGLSEQIKSISESDEYKFLFKANSEPVTEKQPQPTVGGYEPLAGESTSMSFGEMQAKKASDRILNNRKAVSDFWNTYADGAITNDNI